MSGHQQAPGHPIPEMFAAVLTRHGLHPDFDNFWILDPTQCPPIVMEGRRDDTQ